MFPNNYGLGVPPDEECRVHEVQMLIHVLLCSKIEQDVVRLSMQDVYVT
jgi:hypothetical protein